MILKIVLLLFGLAFFTVLGIVVTSPRGIETRRGFRYYGSGRVTFNWMAWGYIIWAVWIVSRGFLK